MEGEIERIFGPAITMPVNPPADAGVSAGVTASHAPSADADPKTEDVNTPSMDAVARLVTENFRINYNERAANHVNEKLAYSLMAQMREYNQAQKDQIKSYGVNPDNSYLPVTAVKIHSAKSMLVELAQYGSGDMPFQVDPTPDPDLPEEITEETIREVFAQLSQLMAQVQAAGIQELPPQVMQQLQLIVAKGTATIYDRVENEKDSVARKRAKRLAKKIWDKMVEGGYLDAAAECIGDACTYGTAVMVGPVEKNVACNKRVKNRKTGVNKIKRAIKSKLCFESISPVDCYPAPGAVNIEDGVFCARVGYTREELWRFKKSSADSEFTADSDGWRENAISLLLARHENGYHMAEFPRNRELEEARNSTDDHVYSCKYEGIRCFAYIDGRKLNEIGITKSLDGTKIKYSEMYYTETVVIDGIVVYCHIYDERVGCPLSKGVFYAIPGSWWGDSIAGVVRTSQSMANNAVIALLRNLGPSASAMMWISDVSRLVDKSPSALTAEPGKIYAFESSFTGQTAAGAPMGVMQIPSVANELLAVTKYATNQADIDSGIPAFTEGAGGSNGGALRTAEGLRTYTEATSRGMRMIVASWDRSMIGSMVRRVADWIMVNDDDMELVGDVEIRPVGLMGKILKAQNDQARLQLFQLCLNSQLMQSILGVKGIVELFRPSCKDININPDNVCPSVERLEMLEQIEGIKQIFAATQAADGVQQNAAAAQGEGGGGVPGIAKPQAVQGAVAQRRGAA